MFEGDRAGLQAAYRIARDRELTLAPFVHAMFGIALHGPKRAVDKAVKGLSLHP